MEAQKGIGGRLRVAAIVSTMLVSALGVTPAAGEDRRSSLSGGNPAVLLAATPFPTPTDGTPMSGMGAGVYCEHCAVCHGDRGEGLTLAFRESFPQELQGCWDRGCHDQEQGDGNGFSLPTVVPAVLGESMADRFGSAASLDIHVRGHMPFQDPGALTDAEYDQVSAYLAQKNGLRGDVVSPDAASPSTATATVNLWATGTPPTYTDLSDPAPDTQAPRGLAAFAGAGATVGVLAVLVMRWLRTRPHSDKS